MHHAEQFKPSSTGHLIQRVIEPARTHIYRRGTPVRAEDLVQPGKELWVLHPKGDPLPLDVSPDKVQVLFITVDPERDTASLLSQYVPAFDSRFLGLRGDLAETEKTAKEFKVFYQKVPGKTPGSYTVDHTAGSYVFDPQGRIRLFMRHGQGVEPIVHDLKILLAEPT